MTRSMPLGRLGAVEDVANACMLLVSPLASYVTGDVWPVDGASSVAS